MGKVRLVLFQWNKPCPRNVDLDALEKSPEGKVAPLLIEWERLARVKALVACGRVTEAHDELMSAFRANDPVAPKV
jgi:hypothetical protein